MAEAMWRFDVFSDYFQFVLADVKARWWESLADAWSDASAQRDQFVQGDDFVVVGTARNVDVPVAVRVIDGPPTDPPSDADRWHDGTLRVHSGVIALSGVTDAGPGERQIQIRVGLYRVRVVWRGLDTVAQNRLEGSDTYEISIWPAHDDRD